MTREEAVSYIKDLKPLLDDPPSGMTDWEFNFIQDTAIKLEFEENHLSEKEDSKLEELHEKYQGFI